MSNTKSANRPVTGIIATLFILSLVTSITIWWKFAWPVLSGVSLTSHEGHIAVIITHTLGGTFMLGAGGLALYVGWTKRWRKWHKVIGYSYIGAGSLGALTALALSIMFDHTPLSLGVSTGTLSVVWLAFAGMALRAALNKRFDSHREWVIRSYVVSWTFVGCRLAQEVPLFNYLGEEGITAGIWLYWITPILICEIALQWKHGSRIKMAAVNNAQ
jgi:hypothetical protein